MLKALRDIVNWALAAAVLLAAVFLLKLTLPIALGIAALVYVGLFFILNPRGAQQVAEAEAVLEVRQVLADARGKVKHISDLGRSLRLPAVKDKVLSACMAANAVLGKLHEDPNTLLSTAKRMTAALAQFEMIVTEYNEILTGRMVADPEKLQSLRDRIENQVLPGVEEAFKEFAVRLDSDDVAGLEVAVRLLTSSLKLEGLS
jgi:hypothetical protein